MKSDPRNSDLRALARQNVLDAGFTPDFGPAAREQVAQLVARPITPVASGNVRDLRTMPWSSIDNDDSRDLDQLELAETTAMGEIRVLVAVADVDTFVPRGSPIDVHAAAQGTTVYTGVDVFPMLPPELSNGITSLLEGADKYAVVVEMVVAADGSLRSETVFRALVRNSAQLTYNSVGPWLAGEAAAPPKIAASPELDAQLRLQDRAAQLLRALRHERGALDIETVETRPVKSAKGDVVGLTTVMKNRASDLIEDFMIAANGVIARRLEAAGVSSIRRVVRSPERWDRIVALAAEKGATLPSSPDSAALNGFLTQQRAADPDRFADLSLAVIKLMGPGEYVLERAGEEDQGHFGLAVQDYTHSTAPNRRYTDLVSQRLVKAVLTSAPPPYTDDELAAIARTCTLREDAARKVERVTKKRVAAAAVADRVGETFDAMVTGVTAKGTFVRVLTPAVEGRLVKGERGADVGDRIRVQLVATDITRGFIDFVAA